MDVLSIVLKTVKLEGAMFYNAEFSAPWSFRSPPSGLVAPTSLNALSGGSESECRATPKSIGYKRKKIQSP